MCDVAETQYTLTRQATVARFAKVVTSRKSIDGGWSVRLLVGWRKPPFNLGAGYKGGATVYLTWRCVNHGDMYRPRKLQFGVTRNANRVPWTRH